jgi:hypothetical protein
MVQQAAGADGVLDGRGESLGGHSGIVARLEVGSGAGSRGGPGPASHPAPSTLLCSLDAIHLASARLLGSDLRAVVTYNERMADVASGLGVPVERPGVT